jgi:hypothetical protein
MAAILSAVELQPPPVHDADAGRLLGVHANEDTATFSPPHDRCLAAGQA